MQEWTRKKAKEAKNYTRALRELKCAYTKNNDVSLELNVFFAFGLVIMNFILVV